MLPVLFFLLVSSSKPFTLSCPWQFGVVVLGRKAAATAANSMEEEVQTEEKQGREQADKRSTGLNGLGVVSDEQLEWKDLTRNNPHKEFFFVVSASFFCSPSIVDWPNTTGEEKRGKE